MRKLFVVVTAVVLIGMATQAYAELQNVEVGGELRIRGRIYRNVLVGRDGRVPVINGAAFNRRPIGPFGLSSVMGWNDRGQSWKRVETYTKLNAKATFSDDVCAFIEFDARDFWGEDFRSDYITGADARANSVDDVEVYQAYIEASNVYGYPVRLRIGRQEIKHGKGWLVSPWWSFTATHSFDAIRMTYSTDTVELDAAWSKLAENSPAEEDGDIDFYYLYGTYKGIEALQMSAYYYLVRDARKFANGFGPVDAGWFGEQLQDWVGVDQYDPTYLHTVGIRLFGKTGGFDYDADIAYQFGNADNVGKQFITQSIWGAYGDDGADFGNWGADIEVGYTFDMNWTPRVYAGFRYFGGEDNREISVWDWINPFYTSEASVSFNRLFSECNCSPVQFENNYSSNFWQGLVGVTAAPTEKVKVGAQLAYFECIDPFDMPLNFDFLGRRYINPLSVLFPFLTTEADDDLGIEGRLWISYNYSEDLWFALRWEHYFVGDGMADGNFVRLNGLDNTGTNWASSDDADLWYWMTMIRF